MAANRSALQVVTAIASVAISTTMAYAGSANGGKTRIVTCMRDDGVVSIQDHACSATSHQIEARERERSAMRAQIDLHTRTKARERAASRIEIPETGPIDLFRSQGGLRDGSGRKWVKVADAYIEIASGQRVTPDRVRIQPGP